MYVIDTECFDEYILFHVRTAKHFFVRFFLWNKCFERRQYFKSVYLHNNITVLIPKEENEAVVYYTCQIFFFSFWTWTLDPGPGPGPWTLNPDPGPWTLEPDPGPWTRTLKNLHPEKAAPWKIWTLKNLDTEKPGINIGLQNMSDFRELCFTKTIRNVSYCFKVRVLTDI